MRFKHRQQNSLPELNLVPMLDVLMTVLTFFIVISMTLTMEKGVEVELPNSEDSGTPAAAPTPLVVKMNPQNEILLNAQSSTEEQLPAQIQSYLANNPKGFVVLQADPQLPYEQVVQMLGDMKKIGGDRVSLAIE
jgi:biopolymer transport protein ExbD